MAFMYSNDVISDEEAQHRTLYVGNLPGEIQESLLVALFGQLGNVVSCKIIRDPLSDPYCFIEFADHKAALTARTAMDGRSMLDKEIKVNWASSPAGSAPKVDTSHHYHIFVGDLSAEVDTQMLKETFQPFGQISDCRVVRDLQTLKSKGYGFVAFVNKEDAETAISGMNGQFVSSRSIRTNWATRKPPGLVDKAQSNGSTAKKLSYNEVFSQSSSKNSTVYCGGIQTGLTDELIKDAFGRFGAIIDVRCFKDKGFAFIKFCSKDSACKAIVEMSYQDIGGYTVKCSWGKESPEFFQPPLPSLNDSSVSNYSASSAASLMNPVQASTVAAAAAYQYGAPTPPAAYPQYASAYWYQPQYTPAAHFQTPYPPQGDIATAITPAGWQNPPFTVANARTPNPSNPSMGSYTVQPY